MIIIDGIADRPMKKLEGKTVLEVANIPNLHNIAKNGILGIFDPLNAPGRRAGSDTAHLSILGYNPYEIYTGRGPIEVAGTGIKLEQGDVSLRCNYCTVDEKLILKAFAAGADGVLVCGCHPGDCHYIKGNLSVRRRVAGLNPFLNVVGIGKDRLRLQWIGASDGPMVPETINSFTETIKQLGPSPLNRRQNEH